ncbi:MAG: polysaccharide export protein [Alphaproteobacteria bacterium]
MKAQTCKWPVLRAGVVILSCLAAGCAEMPDAPLGETVPMADASGYLIGPGDTVQVFVWRNPELSATVPVRPDGRISTPLIEDMPAAGKTPTVLARDIEAVLARYVQKPIVTVIPSAFIGPFSQQIRVVGEASQPRAIPYRQQMTVLDVMIEVGGLTEFAAGNRARIVRRNEGRQTTYRARLDDLLKDGDVTANVDMAPGDIVIIPQSWF